jgi:hypothetical protein
MPTLLFLGILTVNTLSSSSPRTKQLSRKSVVPLVCVATKNMLLVSIHPSALIESELRILCYNRVSNLSKIIQRDRTEGRPSIFAASVNQMPLSLSSTLALCFLLLCLLFTFLVIGPLEQYTSTNNPTFTWSDFVDHRLAPRRPCHPSSRCPPSARRHGGFEIPDPDVGS